MSQMSSMDASFYEVKKNYPPVLTPGESVNYNGLPATIEWASNTIVLVKCTDGQCVSVPLFQGKLDRLIFD